MIFKSMSPLAGLGICLQFAFYNPSIPSGLENRNRLSSLLR